MKTIGLEQGCSCTLASLTCCRLLSEVEGSAQGIGMLGLAFLFRCLHY